MSFGEYFRALRKSKNVTQKAIADEICKSTMLVSGVETNKNKPFSVSDLEKIAKFLELTEREYKELLKEAAKERGVLPPYMLRYLNDHDEAYQLLDMFVEDDMGSNLLKKVIEFTEGLKNV